MTGDPSWEKVDYSLRPSKQIERKLFVETFHKLGKAKVAISDYTYVGFGSIWYVDFSLFHRYLYIDNMFCVEKWKIPKRMDFNKPYEFIQLKMQAFSKFVHRMSAKKKYIVWLDYDTVIGGEILQDIHASLQKLSAESILIVTVDASLKLPDEEFDPEMSSSQLAKALHAYYANGFKQHIKGSLERSRVTEAGLPEVLAEILRSQIDKSLGARTGIAFHQLFNFRYSDGTQMLTIGGILGPPILRDRLNKAGILSLPFVTEGLTPVTISVPQLTAREREFLDGKMKVGFAGAAVPFEINPEALDRYLKFARHYPNYHEVLV